MIRNSFVHVVHKTPGIRLSVSVVRCSVVASYSYVDGLVGLIINNGNHTCICMGCKPF